MFRRTRVVRDSDCDELGHVNNLVWVRFIVRLAYAHSSAVGFDPDDYRAMGAWWIVYRQEIDYRGPAFPGDTLIEETWVSLMKGARCIRESRLLRESDGARLLDARTTWVFADAVRQKPRRIDPRMLACFPVLAQRSD